MPSYLVQLAYTPDAWRALMDSPQNRQDAVTPLVQHLGGRFLNGKFLAFGDYDVVAIVELPDNVSAAAFSMTISAEPAFASSVQHAARRVAPRALLRRVWRVARRIDARHRLSRSPCAACRGQSRAVGGRSRRCPRGRAQARHRGARRYQELDGALELGTRALALAEDVKDTGMGARTLR